MIGIICNECELLNEFAIFIVYYKKLHAWQAKTDLLAEEINRLT